MNKPKAPTSLDVAASGHALSAEASSLATPTKKKVVLVEEPRKMQAERPALLLDLSHSKLLLKYKQQSQTDEAKKASPKSASHTPTKKADTMTPGDDGGVYGAEPSVGPEDAGGVYGASDVATTTTTTTTTALATIQPQQEKAQKSSRINSPTTSKEEPRLNAASREAEEATIATETTELLEKSTPPLATTDVAPSTSTHTSTTNASRKSAFNPLYVILKDKNKYHTTEYI